MARVLRSVRSTGRSKVPVPDADERLPPIRFVLDTGNTVDAAPSAKRHGKEVRVFFACEWQRSPTPDELRALGQYLEAQFGIPADMEVPWTKTDQSGAAQLAARFLRSSS
jgi:hypothetical protein